MNHHTDTPLRHTPVRWMYLGSAVLSCLVFLSIYVTVAADSIQRAPLLLAVAACVFAGYAALGQCKRLGTVFACCFSAMIVGQVFLGYLLMVDYGTWDIHAVTKNAAALVSGEQYNSGYFAVYPNNIAITALFAIIWYVTEALLGTTSIYCLVIMNIAAIDISVLLAVRCMKYISDERTAWRTGILLTMFMPLYLYVPICYTDTFSMPFGMGAMCLALSAAEAACSKNDPVRGVLRSVFAGALIGIGFKIKGSVIVLCVAVPLYWLFRANWKKLVAMAASMLAGILVMLMVCGAAFSHLVPVPDEEIKAWRKPVTHWLMMGLNGMGNFNADDHHNTMAIEGYEAKKEATTAELIRRVEELGFFGLLEKYHYKATRYTWNYGTCFAERYLGDLGDSPRMENIFHEFVLSRGKYHHLFYIYTQGFWVLMMGFALLDFVFGVLDKNPEGYLIRISVFGVMLFLFMWETHPRYILNYTPLLIMAASRSMGRVSDYLCSIIKVRTIRGGE